MNIYKTGTVPFYTSRLHLRLFRTDDAAEMFTAYANDPAVTKYLRWNAHKEVTETWGILNTWVPQYANGDFYQWAVCLKETGEIIGSISAFEAQEEEHKAEDALEIGYCFGQKYWGNGYATEAMRGVLTYLSMWGYQHFIAVHAKPNLASGKVMQKVGMRKIGETVYTKMDGTTKVEGFVYKTNVSGLRLSDV